MRARVFLKKLGILFVFASVLFGMAFSAYVYADKYTWNSRKTEITPGFWGAIAVARLQGTIFAGREDQIYRSLDSGVTWQNVANLGPADKVRSIAVSDDGTHILVSTNDPQIQNDGNLYFSSNSGESFAPTGGFANLDWEQVAMSSDGQRMYAVAPSETLMYFSENGSAAWAGRPVPAGLKAVATSNSGSLVFAGGTDNTLYIYTDYGATLSGTHSVGSNISSLAANGDGNRVVGTVENGYPFYYDYGASSGSDYVLLPYGQYTTSAISDNGTYIAFAKGSGGSVYSSSDGGSTFEVESLVGNHVWTSLSMSADGGGLFLASSDSYLYTGHYDSVAPVINSITGTSATYRTGQTITITVYLDKQVYSSSITLDLETGAVDRSCVISFNDGAPSGSCTYTVQSGDVSSDLSINSITGILANYNGFQNGNLSASSPLLSANNAIVVDGSAPSVSIVSPTNGSYASGTVSITATASDLGTGIAGVQFKYGGSYTNIGAEDTVAPYSVSWNTTLVADSGYSIYAVARDAAGNTATATVATINIDNTAPSAPGTPDLVSASDTGASSTDNITASTTPQFTMSCSNGNTVRLMNSSTILGSATCSSSTATIASSLLATGSYSITAVQVDLAGNIGGASSALPVTIDAVAPGIVFISPADGSVASGTISLIATTTDADSGVYGVQFRNTTAGTNIGSQDTSVPFTVSFDTTGTSDGATGLRATVTDIAGNTAATNIFVTIDNTAPAAPTSIDLTTSSDTGVSSTDNTTSNASPQFTATCESGSTVRFYRGGSTLIGSGTCSSSLVTITSSALVDGSYTITATQTDAAGNVSSASTGLSIVIDTVVAPATILSPSSGATVSGTVAISAVAAPGIYGIQFKADLTNIGSEDVTDPYSASWDSTGVADGAHTLYAVARDIAGNYATSSISVTVDNEEDAPAPSGDPSPSQTSPAPGSQTGSSGSSNSGSNYEPSVYAPSTNASTTKPATANGTIPNAPSADNSAGVPSNFKFTKNAAVSAVSYEVQNLQKMLNTLGYGVAQTGAGSKGNETSYFGPKTRLALIRFQRALAIPTTGFFGPLSRAAMNRILSSMK